MRGGGKDMIKRKLIQDCVFKQTRKHTQTQTHTHTKFNNIQLAVPTTTRPVNGPQKGLR